ncbi:MAG: transposase [Maricaulis sp.]|uniref:integrase core domain-containing protein n=1 Tax=Maricaulis sp. TaxID=1486257 RepID=UPI001B1C3A7E|nr:transposase [Maricaulis sp.]MBO6848532.1 transposase [Maricaulis sp.]MBO6878459.1 transposase [Maricaulis sp.]
MAHARRVIVRWRHDYNPTHPRSALGGSTPAETHRSPELIGGSGQASCSRPTQCGF